MHERAEWGVAAHYGYKEGTPDNDNAWLNRIVDWQQETSDPAHFMAGLKEDLDQDEVFVFTPKGKVVTLPVGATSVDFAYAVHTEVGHSCIGARVNGRLVPLDTTLTSGDTCEIFTSKVENAATRSVSGSAVSDARTRSSRAARSSWVNSGGRACQWRSFSSPRPCAKRSR